MTQEQKKSLEKQLWAVANTLRSSMNADEYRNYILGFIFFKYLSEKQAKYADAILKKDKITFSQIEEKTQNGKAYLDAVKEASLEKLGFFLKPHELFSHIAAKGLGELKDEDTFILEDLKAVLNNIEQTASGTDSEEDFKNLFADVDLTSVKLGRTEKKKNEIIVEVLSHLRKIDFNLDEVNSDVLGDAYEYLIAQFAAGAGKKAGEFYTPSQISKLMARIVSDGKKKLLSVYDPTCGSGSLLLRLREYVDVVDYYGQELNNTTYNLARMNMILHDVHFQHFKIENGDTLEDDRLPDIKAEAVIANPPFSARWKGADDPVLSADERFVQYGRMAPKSSADYAFVTHMLHHLADNGTMAVVLPHGVLFRGGAEEAIRKYIIEKQNYLDAVIGLPANLFYGTSIPATILVFKKCRKADDSILFIDASNEFRNGKNQNHVDEEHIEKIFSTYSKRKEVEKYSHNATFEEIKENDFNLNIPRYVDTFEEEEPIDIDTVAKEIKGLKKQEDELLSEIEANCKELGIEAPF